MSQTHARRMNRRSPRRESTLECRVLAETGDRHLRGETLDVSLEGVRILSDAAVTIGEPVVLTLLLPNGRTWVDAHARVARIESGERAGDPGRAIAFEFTAMDEDDWHALRFATNGAPEAAARRGVFRLAERSWR